MKPGCKIEANRFRLARWHAESSFRGRRNSIGTGDAASREKSVCSQMKTEKQLFQFAWFSIAAALLTLGLKTGAYFVTGSVGLMADAVESLVNLAMGIVVMFTLRIAARPPDEGHAYGHDKAEYFSSGAEAVLIIVVGAFIAFAAVDRFVHPQAIRNLDLGLSIALFASVINLVVAQVLLRAGRRNRSIALEADGQHLMADVWTSVGVLIGIGAVGVTGWQVLDPMAALIVAGHISRAGMDLLRRSTAGLMDSALAPAEVQSVTRVLERYADRGIEFHALRTRRSGARNFVSVHIQVPGQWSVQEGHDVAEAIERDVRQALPSAIVFTHLEPIEDPRSWSDAHLDGPEQQGGQ